MLDKPQIVQTEAQRTAIIRLTISRAEIRNAVRLSTVRMSRALASLTPWLGC